MLSDTQIARYHEDGYVLVEGFLSRPETDLLAEVARLDRAMAGRMITRRDTQGGATQLSLDNELRDNVYSAIVRSERLVRAMEQLLGGEVYHYHHKVSAKQPYEGGAWEWHQDYGYWYNNGCLWPLMSSCYIAIDPATRQNGCMQVIKGSHHMGRVDHGRSGEQTGADMERVEAALERLELVYAEMKPGDGLFFHCNLLHRSDQNRSPDPRWGLICCYNAARNNPYKEGPHPRYTPLEVWPDDCIMDVGRRQLAALKSQA